jgi:hypothetical protein
VRETGEEQTRQDAIAKLVLFASLLSCLSFAAVDQTWEPHPSFRAGGLLCGFCGVTLFAHLFTICALFATYFVFDTPFYISQKSNGRGIRGKGPLFSMRLPPLQNQVGLFGCFGAVAAVYLTQLSLYFVAQDESSRRFRVRY